MSLTKREQARVRSRSSRRLAENAYRRAGLSPYLSSKPQVIEAMAGAIYKRLAIEERLRSTCRWYDNELSAARAALKARTE